MALSFFLILLPGLPVKNSLPVEQTHSANIISFSIYENENKPRLDDFLPLFVCFGSDNFLPAPNQHRTFSYLRQEPGNTGSSLLLAALPHIHSKTACRGVSERQWRSAANRPSRPARLSPSAPATKPAETLGFCRFSFCMCCMVLGFVLVRTRGFLIWFDPFSTVPIPSSTQNAPGFAFLGLFRARFSLFCCFGAAKFLPAFLCILPYSVYKLKPSVIPCRREVSFLT